MSEDNNLNEVHPELGEILENAEHKLVEHVLDSVFEDFKSIEQAMWDRIGDPSGEASIFGVHILADNMADAMDEMTRMGEEAIALNKPDDIESDEGGLIGVELYATTGMVYDLLPSAPMMLAVAEKDPVGMIVRVGGHSSETATKNNKRPSESDDRKDVVVTVMCTQAAVYSIVRFVGEPETTQSMVKKLDEIESGESKLIDALLLTYMGPNVIRDQRPDAMDEFKETLREQINNDNN